MYYEWGKPIYAGALFPSFYWSCQSKLGKNTLNRKNIYDSCPAKLTLLEGQNVIVFIKIKYNFIFIQTLQLFNSMPLKPTTVKCENCVHYQCMHVAVQSPDCLCSYSIIT